jgi:aminopeptidase-like protein
MRSKYGEYPEYHTSLDNLDFISPEGLEGAHNVLWKTIELIENNYIYQAVFPCEPQLGKRGLYPNISSVNTDYASIEDMMNFLAYADGEQDLIEIADTINVPASKLINLASKLLAHGVIKKI